MKYSSFRAISSSSTAISSSRLWIPILSSTSKHDFFRIFMRGSKFL